MKSNNKELEYGIQFTFWVWIIYNLTTFVIERIISKGYSLNWIQCFGNSRQKHKPKLNHTENILTHAKKQQWYKWNN